MRFIANLLPLLTAAATEQTVDAAARLSRVVSVFDPYASVRFGGSGKLDFSDLSLKRTFSLSHCQAHTTLMNNFFLERLAQAHPHTSFIHEFPAGVATDLARDLPAGKVLKHVLWPLLRPFLVPLEESGERHLFAATSARFPPRARGEEMGESVVVGSQGTKGGGCYWLNWDGEALPANKKIDRLRKVDAVEKVVMHTDEVFTQVCEEGKVYLPTIVKG